MDSHPSKNSFSEHLLEYRTVKKKRLLVSFLVTSLVMVLEVVGGLLTNSIALISDAGHMFTHSFAIAISLIAVYIARRPACHHKTFGLFRAEILAAFINGLFLLLVVITLVYEAIMRINLVPGKHHMSSLYFSSMVEVLDELLRSTLFSLLYLQLTHMM